jgi:hypothetical protein
VAVDVLLLKWCDVYIVSFLDLVQFCIRYYYVVSCSFVCCVFFCTSCNVVVGVCIVSRVLRGSVTGQIQFYFNFFIDLNVY